MEDFTHSVVSEWGLSWKQQQDTPQVPQRWSSRHSLGLDVLTDQGPCRLSGHLLLNHGLCRRWGSLAPWGSASTLGPSEKGSKGLEPQPASLPGLREPLQPVSPPLLCFPSPSAPLKPTTRPPPKHNSSLKPGQKGERSLVLRNSCFQSFGSKSPETKKLSGLTIYLEWGGGGGVGVGGGIQ